MSLSENNVKTTWRLRMPKLTVNHALAASPRGRSRFLSSRKFSNIAKRPRRLTSTSFFFVPDPFADASKGADDDVQDGLVHIRIQQRNGRKTLTTVQGLSSDYDLKKIVRACKKVCIILILQSRNYHTPRL